MSVTHSNAYKSANYYIYLRKQLENDLGVWRVYDRKHDRVYEEGSAFHDVVMMVGIASNYKIDKAIAAILPSLVDCHTRNNSVNKFVDETPESHINRLARLAIEKGWQKILTDDILNMTHTPRSIERICQITKASTQQTKALTDLLSAVRGEFLTMANQALRSN